MTTRWQDVARDMRRSERLQASCLRRVRTILGRSSNGCSWGLAGETSVRTWELLPTGWWITGAEGRGEEHQGRWLNQAEHDSLRRAERAMYAAGHALRNHPTPNVYEAAELERACECRSADLTLVHQELELFLGLLEDWPDGVRIRVPLERALRLCGNYV